MRSGYNGITILSKILRNIVLILFIVIFVSIVYNFRNQESATESALLAEASYSTNLHGVFIRDEQIITRSGSSGYISYGVPDGGRLGKGSVIAEIYNSDEQIKINREIKELNNELNLLSKMQNPGTIEAVQPANLSADIEKSYRNLIYNSNNNSYEEIKSYMDDFLVLLSTYQIVTNEPIDLLTRTNDINNRIAQLTAAKVEPIEVITSDRSAYFVSYCDGYEESLTMDSVDSLTIEQLSKVENKREKFDNVVGKLVDGYSWYIAGVVDNSKNTYNPGDRVTLKFGYSADTFDGKIAKIQDEGDASKALVIVSCEQFTYDLVQHRCAEVELIQETHSGLKVPREAIRFVPIEEKIVDEETGITTTVTKNYKGVYVREGEQVSFRKIDVVYEGTDFVLSEIHKEDDTYLALYDDIMLEGVDSDE